MKITPETVVAYWLETVGPAHWFDADAVLDAAIAERFGHAWKNARDGKFKTWEKEAEGALALVLLLDQFPRNMFRGKADAFSTDEAARGVARRALARGYDLIFPAGLRAFFYLPYMHSERLEDQERCVSLIAERLGTSSMNYPFARAHCAEIVRFGRFPRRNAALKRRSTPAERRFLAELSSR